MAGNVKFGLKIKHLREAKKVTDPAFSLRRFAEAVGLSPTFISKIENGEFDPPRAEKIIKIAELLGTDPDELLELAGRADPDLVEQVKKPQVADFLRTATENLSEKQLRELTEKIRAMKKQDDGERK
ncbi:MAG: helix-turn-helix domain-containing protein [Deltaproteobacteria bacterium]|nr:helix-turn-helix domain-containing protein [Deltaproteobacteria bacterium]